jgi:predicted small lipoprotein YifL
MPASDMYDRDMVYFGRGQRVARVACRSRAQAELLSRLAGLGLRGPVQLPASEEASRQSLVRLDKRLAQARATFESLAHSRSGDDKTRVQVVELLLHWFLHGRDRPAVHERV